MNPPIIFIGASGGSGSGGGGGGTLDLGTHNGAAMYIAADDVDERVEFYTGDKAVGIPLQLVISGTSYTDFYGFGPSLDGNYGSIGAPKGTISAQNDVEDTSRGVRWGDYLGGNKWIVYKLDSRDVPVETVLYYSADDTDYPWQATTWVRVQSFNTNPITVTENPFTPATGYDCYFSKGIYADFFTVHTPEVRGYTGTLGRDLLALLSPRDGEPYKADTLIGEDSKMARAGLLPGEQSKINAASYDVSMMATNNRLMIAEMAIELATLRAEIAALKPQPSLLSNVTNFMKNLIPLFFLVATTAFGAAGDVIFKQINPSGTAITDRVLANPSAIRIYSLNSSAGTWRPTQFALGTVFSVSGAFGSQTLDLDTDLTVIAGLTPSNNDVLQRKSGAWTNRTLSQYWTDLMADPGPGSYSYTALPFTINTDKRLLGRDNAIPPGVAQEISIGTGLTLASSTLSLNSSQAVTSITGTAAEITASASVGAVTLSLPTALTFTGKTVTGGTFNSGAFNGTLGVTTRNEAAVSTLTVGAVSAITGPLFIINDYPVVGAQINSWGANPSLQFRRANGTPGSESVVLNGDTLLNIGGGGWNGSAMSGRRGAIEVAATENWSGTNQGAETRIYATPNTTTSVSLAATFTSTGINSTAIGATTPSTVAATTLQATTSVLQGGGMKHQRVTTGSISAGSTALVTLTWSSAFADANVTVTAGVVDSTGSSLSLSVVHIESITASAVAVRVINNAVGSLTGVLHVIAMHD